MALTRYPDKVSFPFRSSGWTLSQPAPTVGTFAQLLLGSVNYKWDPAEGQAENNKKYKYHPAGLGHLLLDDGHANMVAKRTF